MIKPPSLQHEYSFCYSGDPALDWPFAPEGDAEAEAARSAAIVRARETGSYPIRPGCSPIVYTIRPLTGSLLNRWIGELNRQRLVKAEGDALAVRFALRDVVAPGRRKVTMIDEDGVSLASIDDLDAIYASTDGRAVVGELAEHVIERATATIRPLSSRG